MGIRIRDNELYIPVFTDLPDHRKTLRLARGLGLPAPWALGHFVQLLLRTLKGRPSGVFERSEAWLIADWMGYPPRTDGGKKRKTSSRDREPMADRWATDRQVLKALIDAEFLDVLKGGKDGTRVSIHEWERYAGCLAQVEAAIAKDRKSETPTDRPPIRPPTMSNENRELSIEKKREDAREVEPIERPPAMKSGSNAALLVSTWNSQNRNFPITPDKGIRHVEATLARVPDEKRGELTQRIEVAFWDGNRCKGKKIYEVLDEVLSEFSAHLITNHFGQGGKGGTGPGRTGLNTNPEGELARRAAALAAGADPDAPAQGGPEGGRADHP